MFQVIYMYNDSKKTYRRRRNEILIFLFGAMAYYGASMTIELNCVYYFMEPPLKPISRRSLWAVTCDILDRCAMGGTLFSEKDKSQKLRIWKYWWPRFSVPWKIQSVWFQRFGKSLKSGDPRESVSVRPVSLSILFKAPSPPCSPKPGNLILANKDLKAGSTNI